MKKLVFIYKLFVFLIFSFVFLIMSLYIYTYYTPKINIKNSNKIVMLDKDENIFYQNIGTNSWVSLDNISEYAINAIISVEDKNFYVHRGFDYLRILKALYVDLKKGSLEQGASTISQQYVKNLYLSFDKTWKRKIDEAFLTLDLEVHYSKDEILEGYLNTINFGSGCFGIEEASLYYFNKNAKDLSLSEASIVVGIPKNPTYYNPIIYYKNAKERQQVVLNSMVNNGLITREEASRAFEENLVFYGKKDNNLVISSLYYKDAVLNELNEIKEIPKSLIETGGLVIYTNLDSNIQKKTEEIIKEEMVNSSDLQVGVLIRNPNTGAVVSLIGGKNYSESEFNRVIQANRQVGSSIKPILYLAALNNGMTPVSTFSSEKTNFYLNKDVSYSPKNYGNNYPNKDITMALAIAVSDNIYAVKTHLFLGTNILRNTASLLGINKDLKNIASLALGTDEISMIDFSNAYATLANEGIKNKPFFINKVTDLNGNILYEYNYEEEVVYDNRYVFILNNMLSNTYNYSYIDYASPTLLSIKGLLNHKYAVKSGTTDTDYWTVGYNKEALVMVWNGYDDNRSIDDISSLITKRIWARTIENYLEGNEDSWYDIPSGVVGTIVNPINGSVSDLTKKDLLFFIKGTETYYSAN